MNEYAVKAGKAYETALKEVLQGKNLDKHYKDAEKSVTLVDNKIKEMKSLGLDTNSLCELKSKLNFLKIQIEQRKKVDCN